MMQNELITKREMAAIGEEIGYELGARLVKAYQEAHPSDVQSYIIGKNIINEILAQPGCVAIEFHNAINELGEKTLVYIGLDQEGKSILKYSFIDNRGQLSTGNGIVADRAGTRGRSGAEDDSWGWVD